jgi:hypothetical protein
MQKKIPFNKFSSIPANCHFIISLAPRKNIQKLDNKKAEFILSSALTNKST